MAWEVRKNEIKIAQFINESDYILAPRVQGVGWAHPLAVFIRFAHGFTAPVSLSAPKR